jgi:predicted transcriptional regulator
LETLSIRIDASKRSRSVVAAEAIAAYVESEAWQFGESQAGIAELNAGQNISHDKVSKWLNFWGKTGF